MRMSRNRRKCLHTHRHFHRWLQQKQLPLAGMALGTVLTYNLEASAETLNVLQDIASDFDYMQNNITNIQNFDLAKGYVVEAEQNLMSAEYYVKEAEQVCLDAEANLQDAELNQKQAEEDLHQTENALADARARREALTAQAIAAQQAVADYLPTWYEAQADLQHKVDVQEAAEYNKPASIRSAEESWSASQQERAAWIQAAWEEADFESNRLPELEARFDGGSAVGVGAEEAAAAEEAYWEQLSELESETETSREYFDSVSEYLDELKAQQQDAEEMEADVRQEVMELQVELGQNQQYLRESIADVELCKKDREDAYTYQLEAIADREAAVNDVYLAKFALLHFDDGMGAQKTLEYYSWQGAQGLSGHQLYSGNSFYMSKNHYEFSLSNAYVVSNTGLDNGDMSGLTDTTLSAMYTNKHPVYEVRYGMDINLPTGESRNHNNDSVPDYMARTSRLGEGWNFTPRLEITRNLDKYTSATWRTSYSFRGSYADSLEDMSARTSPGNLWSNELEYLHTDDTTQYMFKLQHTLNSKSSISGLNNNYSFTEGDGWLGKAYYRKWFAPKDAWGAYMAWSFDQAAAYDTDLQSGAGVHRFYYGGGWFHKFDDKRQLRLLANWLRSEGNAYDPLTRQTHSSGRRFSVSLGYDWRMDDQNSLSLYVERAILRQQGDANYRSWGVALSYNRSF